MNYRMKCYIFMIYCKNSDLPRLLGENGNKNIEIQNVEIKNVMPKPLSTTNYINTNIDKQAVENQTFGGYFCNKC